MLNEPCQKNPGFRIYTCRALNLHEGNEAMVFGCVHSAHYFSVSPSL